MNDLLLGAIRDACQPYLRDLLARSAAEEHPHLEGLFDTHMAALTDYCLASYQEAGTLTVDFIRGLHKAFFPMGYRKTVTDASGREVVWMEPGEFKRINNQGESILHPGRITVFVAPAEVPQAMVRLVARLNYELPAAAGATAKRDAILFFILDFFDIHPFGDANSRIACILADLLAIREGLPPFYFHTIKAKEQSTITRAAELARETRDLTPLNEVLARHGHVFEEEAG
ncbi:MAG: Fic family protein [Desulfurivibrionaceae bacterium]|jgi:Fic family protein